MNETEAVEVYASIVSTIPLDVTASLALMDISGNLVRTWMIEMCVLRVAAWDLESSLADKFVQRFVSTAIFAMILPT